MKVVEFQHYIRRHSSTVIRICVQYRCALLVADSVDQLSFSDMADLSLRNWITGGLLGRRRRLRVACAVRPWVWLLSLWPILVILTQFLTLVTCPTITTPGLIVVNTSCWFFCSVSQTVVRSVFIYSLFTGPFSVTSNDRVKGEWQIVNYVEWSGHGLIQITIRAFSWRIEENHKKLSRDNRSSGRDLNPRFLEYEMGLLITRRRRSVYYTSLMLLSMDR
jgi:hypothetical protein